MNNYKALFFERASEFIEEIGDSDKAKVLAAIKMMETDFEAVHTKILKAPIRELIVKKCRLVFFLEGGTLYFVSGFMKKTKKTPKYEIEYALEIYSRFN